MRELKVRIWDKIAKFYVGEDELYLGITFDGKFLIYKDEITDEVEFSKIDDFIIEQSTGLKDKNGKEIYEGDICRLAYYTKKEGKKRWHKDDEDVEAVEFEDGYFKFSNTDQYGIGSELSFSDYGEWSTADGSYKYEAEVIGNIHEDPELLGGD